MADVSLSWTVEESGAPEKTSTWYWVVGIVAFGGTAASVIAGNYLFSVLIIIGAFALMLAGSRGGTKYRCSLSERGIRIGEEAVPFEKIKRFAVVEEAEPPLLVLDIQNFMGVTSVPLSGIDFREVRTHLKNKNVEEADELGSTVEKIARAVGL